MIEDDRRQQRRRDTYDQSGEGEAGHGWTSTSMAEERRDQGRDGKVAQQQQRPAIDVELDRAERAVRHDPDRGPGDRGDGFEGDGRLDRAPGAAVSSSVQASVPLLH